MTIAIGKALGYNRTKPNDAIECEKQAGVYEMYMKAYQDAKDRIIKEYNDLLQQTEGKIIKHSEWLRKKELESTYSELCEKYDRYKKKRDVELTMLRKQLKDTKKQYMVKKK